MKRFRFTLLLMLTLSAGADELLVSDADGNEIQVEVYPSDSDLLIIWLVDHEEHREMFEQLLQEVNREGAELWRVDLLESYFLPRSSENQRTLPGDGVAALLEAAHEQRNKRVLLAAYDRMPLTLLRGVRRWQRLATGSRLAGAVLFYPNLFGPAPVAGEDPVIDPIVKATNIPVVIYQPEIGSQRWRLGQVMESLWQGGSPAFAYIVPKVRDWFFMGGEGDHGPEDRPATARIPAELQRFATLLERFPKPDGPVSRLEEKYVAAQVQGLVQFPNRRRPPGFALSDIDGSSDNWNNYRGKVTLVNFWATWCPPCVEEVPSLNRLVARNRGSDFGIVSIDYRETPDEPRSFMEKIPMDFPVLLDADGQSTMQWKVFSFPSSFLIDRQGFIRYSANRAIDWDTADIHYVIDQLLAE